MGIVRGSSRGRRSRRNSSRRSRWRTRLRIGKAPSREELRVCPWVWRFLRRTGVWVRCCRPAGGEFLPIAVDLTAATTL